MSAETNRLKVEPDLDFVNEVLTSGGESLKKCFQCGTCSVVCNLAPDQNPFPRQEMIWAQWGLSKLLLADPNLWLCHQCSDCTASCPRGARPGDVLNAIRKKVIASLAFPSFMGKALADPLYWPALFLFPALVILGTMIGTGHWPIPQEAELKFSSMITHVQLNVIFPFFSGLAALAFLIGVYRLLQGAVVSPLTWLKGLDQRKMFTAVKDVVIKIALHKDFEECEVNRWRRLAHLLVFYAFGGLLLTTVLAIFVLVAYDYKEYLPAVLQINLGEYPMNMSHPVKWLGNLSAAALILGSGLMIINRLKLGAGGDLASSAFDLFFLLIVFGVGITGLLAQLLRFAELPAFAFPTYFLHLVLVFSLLIYSPYSKFAHFVYRTVALILIRYNELAASAGQAVETSEEVKAQAA